MTEKRYLFICPNCFQEIIVDYEIKEELLDIGCILCESKVKEIDFKSKKIKILNF